MAVATTLRRGAFNRGYQSTVNLSLASSTGVSAGVVLTVAGDTQVTVVHELPNLCWKGEVTATAPGSARLLFKPGDTVTG